MMFAGWNVDGTTSATAKLQEKTQPARASLRIYLRLADDRPFAGTANLRVMPNEGYELLGTPTESEGEIVFVDVVPGNYIVEVSAPGFLAQRLRAQVEEGSGQKIIVVIMRPRPAQKITETIPREPREGGATQSTTGGARNYWRPHELEEFVPPVDENVQCPTENLLRGAGQRMVELVANLEKFSAKEQVEHFAVQQEAPRGAPELRTFDYVVTVSRNVTGTVMLQEYRNGKDDPNLFPAHIASLRAPGTRSTFPPGTSTRLCLCV